MAFRSDNEQDPVEETAEVDARVQEPTHANGQDEKRRGRAARRRRREALAEVALTETAEQDRAPEALEAGARKKDAPTPGRRQKEQAGNRITRLFRPVTNYFQETMVELRKVTWPTREESLRLSGIVLGTTFISAMVLGLYNYVLGLGLDLLLRLIP